MYETRNHCHLDKEMGDTRTFDRRKEEGTTVKATAPLMEKWENDEQVTPASHTGDRENSMR
jgi:hypothetical protein